MKWDDAQVLSAAPRCCVKKSGFTLIELLIVIAVIGIMTALIVGAITNSASDARLVIGRQQQAVLQEALNAWVAAQASGTSSLQNARSTYTAASTSLARLNLVKDYLDAITYEHMTNFTTDASKIQTDALAKNGLYLQFSTWNTTNYPRINMAQ
jgi:prepilin-type N-terminal cleavage/methylation domain-containing protein